MNQPTHEEISRRAHHLWQESRSTAGDPDQYWLEAERQLKAGAPQPAAGPVSAQHTPSPTVSESQSAGAAAERVALQRKEARQPQLPSHTAPRAIPAESGKPLWNQPHSS